MAKTPRARRPLPTREELLAFIEESGEPVGKREIARAFGIRGDDRAALKDMLRSLEDEGLLDRGKRRRLASPSRLPPVTVVEITGVDEDGEPLARPMGWKGDGAPPGIIMLPERRGRPALAVGDRVLARLSRLAADSYEGSTIRRLPRAPERIVGFYRVVGGEGRISPTDRRVKSEYAVERGDAMGARRGELVLAEYVAGRHLGLPRARVVERLGASLTDARAISLIAIHGRGIPVDFPEAALAEARGARGVKTLKRREDLRGVPMVTIDGATARDFDDAVWAGPDPARHGGWQAIVAIADVGLYVRPGGALDDTAYARGNSVYFPDRVVPMLPERLSNDLCSLRPGEPRPCLAVHLTIDADGSLVSHRFVRGLMRSAARLTYEQVQAARDGRPDDDTAPLVKTVIKPLYGAFHALHRARVRRGTIDLDLPEREILLDPEGRVASIRPAARLDSHRLIEELMITANVAAAETLEALRAPVMYRVHDRPSAEKIVDLRTFLKSLGHQLAGGVGVQPGHFSKLLAEVETLPHAHAVNTAILRSQSQAAYSPRNLGHFGLSLRRYSHFTSPIRRYADLLVHRALIAGLGLGPGGLEKGAEDRFEEIGESLSKTERRAAAAERDAVDRFTTAYMADQIGAVFRARISGVARFGAFVSLDDSGAEGFIPRSSLPDDFVHDEPGQCLVGNRLMLRLGDAVEVRLEEAEIATASLVFELVSGGSEVKGGTGKAKRKPARKKPRTARRGVKRRR